MRLIDAVAAREEFADNLAYMGSEVKRILNLSPTVDAVEVIRCVNCKLCQYDDMFKQRWCNGQQVKDDHFCSCGVRKDGAE